MREEAEAAEETLTIMMLMMMQPCSSGTVMSCTFGFGGCVRSLYLGASMLVSAMRDSVVCSRKKFRRRPM